MSCADPESFVRVGDLGPKFWYIFFIPLPIPSKQSGPLSADDGATLNAAW